MYSSSSAMDTGIWRKSGRRTVHLGRFYDIPKEAEEDPIFFNYFPAEISAGSGSGSSSKRPMWKVLWKNLLKQKRKILEPSRVHEKAPYNSETYMQNFDEGQSGQTIDEYLNDFLPRSFTARYADPSKLLS